MNYYHKLTQISNRHKNDKTSSSSVTDLLALVLIFIRIFHIRLTTLASSTNLKLKELLQERSNSEGDSVGID